MADRSYLRRAIRPALALSLMGGAAVFCGACSSTSSKVTNTTSGVVDLSNATVVNSNVKVVQVIGHVEGLPPGQYSEIMKAIDGEGLLAAKQDLKVVDFKNDVRLIATRLGFKFAGTYTVQIRNVSPTKSYSVSGQAMLVGRVFDKKKKSDLLIKSHETRITSEGAVALAPGETGSLQFTLNHPYTALTREAEELGVVLTESQVNLVAPNDGVVWRPNWPDETDGSIQVGLKVSQLSSSPAQ